MSLPRHKLIENLHKFTRLIRGGAFDPYSDGVTAVLSVSAAMLKDDERELAEQKRRAEVAEAWQARLTSLLAQRGASPVPSQHQPTGE